MIINSNNISLKTNANIQTIEYTGSGQLNTDNVLTFTFGFIPKIVILSGNDGTNMPVVAAYGCDKTTSSFYKEFYQVWTWEGRTVTLKGRRAIERTSGVDELFAAFNMPGKSYTITAIG